MLALVEVFFTPLHSVVTLVTLSLLSLLLSLFFLTRASPTRACSLSLSLSLVLVAAQGPPTSPAVPCLARRTQCHRSAPSTGRHSASHRRCAMPRRPPAPRGISAKVGMSSSEPCPRPGAKDTSCTLRPCRALARAEPPQLRSSSGCKRYILNALLMLRTSGCRRYTLKVTCRLNVRAHSSSSLPLQSAAYASASTRSLCAPQRAHNAVSLCQCALPCDRLAWKFGGRALPPQLQRVLALSPPRVGRLPSALLRTTCALRAQPLLSKFSFSSVLPPWRAREAIRPTRPQNEITCGRQLPHCRNRRNGSAQRSPVCCRVQQTSLALEQRFLDCCLSRQRDSRLFRAPGPPGDQADDRLRKRVDAGPHPARQRRALCH